MNSDFETVKNNGRAGASLKTVLALFLVAFIGGIALAGWLISKYDLLGNKPASNQLAQLSPLNTNGQAAQNRTVSGAVTPAARAINDSAAAAALANDDMSQRVQDMELRLSRIFVQAEQASGNAARAEGLLIAFAVRRALDQGRSLGYLEAQLQQRFGLSHPAEVKVIREFTRDPLTRDMLETELDDFSSHSFADKHNSFWASLGEEFSNLFTIRRSGSSPTDSESRLKRAQKYAASGNIAATIAEVEKLSRSDKIDSWLVKARRYAAAQSALDRLERAALETITPASSALTNNTAAATLQPALPAASSSADENAAEKAESNGNFFSF